MRSIAKKSDVRLFIASDVLGEWAAFWAWNGIAYHWMLFSANNPAAYLFGGLFVLQALLFIAVALRGGLCFGAVGAVRAVSWWIFIAYAMIAYELLGMIAGPGWLKGPLFGVAPCPTVIFTIGVLLLAQGKAVKLLALIPMMWAAVASSAALLLGVPEDLGLTLALAALLIALVWWKLQSVA